MEDLQPVAEFLTVFACSVFAGSSLDKQSARAAQLLSRWGQLHAVRSLMSIPALVLFWYLLTISRVP